MVQKKKKKSKMEWKKKIEALPFVYLFPQLNVQCLFPLKVSVGKIIYPAVNSPGLRFLFLQLFLHHDSILPLQNESFPLMYMKSSYS